MIQDNISHVAAAGQPVPSTQCTLLATYPGCHLLAATAHLCLDAAVRPGSFHHCISQHDLLQLAIIATCAGVRFTRLLLQLLVL